jgi:hypothetical protein
MNDDSAAILVQLSVVRENLRRAEEAMERARAKSEQAAADIARLRELLTNKESQDGEEIQPACRS